MVPVHRQSTNYTIVKNFTHLMCEQMRHFATILNFCVQTKQVRVFLNLFGFCCNLVGWQEISLNSKWYRSLKQVAYIIYGAHLNYTLERFSHTNTEVSARNLYSFCLQKFCPSTLKA